MLNKMLVDCTIVLALALAIGGFMAFCFAESWADWGASILISGSSLSLFIAAFFFEQLNKVKI